MSTTDILESPKLGSFLLSLPPCQWTGPTLGFDMCLETMKYFLPMPATKDQRSLPTPQEGPAPILP